MVNFNHRHRPPALLQRNAAIFSMLALIVASELSKRVVPF